MSPKKQGYSLDQHDKLGLELQTMRDRLGEIVEELGAAYSFKLSDRVKKAKLHLDGLRIELGSIACQENPGIGAFRLYQRNLGANLNELL